MTVFIAAIEAEKQNPAFPGTAFEKMHIIKQIFFQEGAEPMNEKLPFYMAYQNQLPIDTAWERENSRDAAYMKSMYPTEVKKILPYVEAECDRLEYDVSMIYDEYPDRLQIQMICDRVYVQVKDQMILADKQNGKDIGAQGKKLEEAWLRELVWVMTCQEICRRRQERRDFRRKYYFLSESLS